jgi:ribonuclease III
MVGYEFADSELLLQSLTHSSYSNEAACLQALAAPLPDNERLEFLGDAVIGLVIAKALMELFPNASEGKLSRWRSSLVSRKTLAELAMELKLGDYILLGRGEKQTGGAEKRSILAAVLEALIGSLYLDGGMEKATNFLMAIYRPLLADLERGDESFFRLMDKKTHLQERTQSLFKAAPLYRLVEAWGPEHEKFFRVEIIIEGRVIARGDGRSKKDAEQQAASLALEVLGF